MGHCMLNRCNASGNAGSPGFTGNCMYTELCPTSADWNEYQKYKSLTGITKQRKKSADRRLQRGCLFFFLKRSRAQVVLKYESSFAKSI